MGSFFLFRILRQDNIKDDRHNGCRNNTGTAKDQLDALRQMCKDAAAGSDSIAKSQCDGDDRDIAHRHRFFGNKLDSADHDG